MSVSGPRAAVDIDLEDLEKRLRTAAAPSAVEDPLAELARLVEASRPKGAGAEAAPRLAALAAHPFEPPAPAPRTPAPPALETGALRPALDDAAGHESEYAEGVSAEEPMFETYPEHVVAPPAPPARRRPRRWLLTVSALAVAGVAMIGAVVALRGLPGLPGIARQPPFIAAAVGPTKVQPPSDETVASSNDSGANLLKDNTQPSNVKVVSNEEQPVDLNAETAAPPPAPPAAADSSGGPVVRGTVDTPVVVAPPQPSPAASPFPEPKPVRTMSLRPDGTPIPASVADAEASQTQPAQPSQPATPPKTAAKPLADAANAQASTPKIELPTKLSPPKSSARVVVAKTDTTAPGDAPGAPVQLGAAVKPEKPAKAKTQEAAAEPATPAESAEPAATSSGGWAVQLAAPRSEAEAKSVVAKLNEKYASALGGSALGVHKATVNGETVYRVRVAGLTKADAAALCARVKGDGGQCFVAK
jgi:SPOR domain